MAKTLRVLTDPDFTTKGSVLTKEEADQDLIDIWNEFTSGSGTVNAGTLQVAGTNLFPDGDPQDLGIGDDVTFNQLILTTRWRNQSTDKWEAGFNRITQSSTYRGLQIGNTNNRDWHVGSTSTDSSTDRHDLIFAGGSSGASDVILGVTRTSDGGANWIPEFRMFGDGTTQWAKAATFNAGLTSNGNITVSSTLPKLILEETDQASKQFDVRVSGGNFSIAETGTKVMLTLAAGGDATLFQSTKISEAFPQLFLEDTDASNKNWDLRVSGGDLSIAETGVGSFIDMTAGGGIGFNSKGLSSIGSVAINAALTSGSVLTVGGDADVQGDLEVTGRLDAGNIFADEFVINHTSVIGGNLIISPARGKIDSINAGASTVTISDPNATGGTQFQANDIFVVEAVDVNGATIVSADGTVTSVSGTTLTLSFTTGVIGDLSVGDVIVQRGSTSDTARQALIETTATATGAPYMRFYRNLDAVADFGNTANIAVQIGTAQSVTGFSEPGIFGFKTDGTVGFGFTQGKLFFDGLTQVIHVPSNTAGSTTNEDIGSGPPTGVVWSNFAEQTAGGAADTERDTKHSIGWYKRFGIDTIRLVYRLNQVTINSDINVTNTARVYLYVQDYLSSNTVATTNAEWTTSQSASDNVLDLDVSGLTDDTRYTIYIDLFAEVDPSGQGGGLTYDTRIEVLADIAILGATD